MKFFKCFVGENIWEEITEKKVVDYTEGRGYYDADTVISALKAGAIIRTPWAYYKAEGQAARAAALAKKAEGA